jgi:hypothetical protein
MPEVDLIPVPGSNSATHEPKADEFSRTSPFSTMSFLRMKMNHFFLSLSPHLIHTLMAIG